MTQIWGRTERKLDYKGRLAIPDDIVGTEGGEWRQMVAMRQSARLATGDRPEVPLLAFYEMSTWQAYLEEAAGRMDDDEARHFMETVVGDAARLDVDSMKRVTVPAALLRHAGLEREVIVMGVFNHLEVWNPDTYKTYADSLPGEVETFSIADLARARIREVPQEELRRAE